MSTMRYKVRTGYVINMGDKVYKPGDELHLSEEMSLGHRVEPCWDPPYEDAERKAPKKTKKNKQAESKFEK